MAEREEFPDLPDAPLGSPQELRRVQHLLSENEESLREEWNERFGIHWPDVDEDLSTAGLLRGVPAAAPLQTSR